MEQKVILFQGDSITDADRNRTNDLSMGCGYPTLVTGHLGAAFPYQYKFYNRGIGGHRVVDLYARIKADMINLKPDYMSILIGINDVWHEIGGHNGVDAEKFEMVYGWMIEELLRELPDLKLMLLEPFVLPGSATRSNDENPGRWEYFRSETDLRRTVVKRLAEKYDLVFVPLQERFSAANADAPEDGYWLSDGVHPTAAGHELIKQAWLEGFSKL
jgi:lysophospholipase L1-like esterase